MMSKVASFISKVMGGPFSLSLLAKKIHGKNGSLEDLALPSGWVFLAFWYAIFKPLMNCGWSERLSLALCTYVLLWACVVTALNLGERKVLKAAEQSRLMRDIIDHWCRFWLPLGVGFTLVFFALGQTPLRAITYIGLAWLAVAVACTLLWIFFHYLKERACAYLQQKHPHLLRGNLPDTLSTIFTYACALLLFFLAGIFSFYCLALERGLM